LFFCEQVCRFIKQQNRHGADCWRCAGCTHLELHPEGSICICICSSTEQRSSGRSCCWPARSLPLFEYIGP
jgi:hypothetical protein